MSVERETHSARRAYAWLAAISVVLTLAVVVASAYLRHSQVGPSCEPWPQCQAREDAARAEAVPGDFVNGARIVHRLSATAVAAAIVGLLLVAWTQRPIWLREALVATAALIVAAALAVLGALAGGSKSPAVVLANLLGGYLLLTLVATALAFAVAARAPSLRIRTLALASLVAAFVVAAIGGAISALNACPGSLACDWISLDAKSLNVAHGIGAVALLAPACVLVWRIRLERRRLASALSITLAAALASGIAVLVVQPFASLLVAHNATSALSTALLAMAGTSPRLRSSGES